MTARLPRGPVGAGVYLPITRRDRTRNARDDPSASGRAILSLTVLHETASRNAAETMSLNTALPSSGNGNDVLRLSGRRRSVRPTGPGFRTRFDGFMTRRRVRPSPEGNEDSTPAVRRKTGSDVSLGSSVTPGRCRRTRTTQMVHTRRCAPATHPSARTGTFRLILPEAIAIGVRFSHASRAGLDPRRKAP